MGHVGGGSEETAICTLTPCPSEIAPCLTGFHTEEGQILLQGYEIHIYNEYMLYNVNVVKG